MKYHLVDLERTKGNDIWYWKPGAWGYTNEKENAGKFAEKKALDHCLNDIKGNTVMLPIKGEK